MARLARMVSDNYDNVNRDLLLTGAILHDLGKILNSLFKKLLIILIRAPTRHITIGVEMIEKRSMLSPAFLQNYECSSNI